MRSISRQKANNKQRGWDEWFVDLKLCSIPQNCKRLKNLYTKKALIKLNTEDSTILKKVKDSKNLTSTLNLGMTVSSIQPKKKKQKVDQSIPEVLESLFLC